METACENFQEILPKLYQLLNDIKDWDYGNDFQCEIFKLLDIKECGPDHPDNFIQDYFKNNHFPETMQFFLERHYYPDCIYEMASMDESYYIWAYELFMKYGDTDYITFMIVFINANILNDELMNDFFNMIIMKKDSMSVAHLLSKGIVDRSTAIDMIKKAKIGFDDYWVKRYILKN